ncbi:MAG: hypothetical protein JXA41_08395 [Deltaproteobacteria bacterium]|nr:hypothetical protein [Deltaproteobacteria bacterium]
MLTGIHFLLTYKCLLECDHCFLYSGPHAQGTMTLHQIRRVLEEAQKIKTVEWIYIEGGEAFLFYPLMLEGTKIARTMGFKVGIVTNAYWAVSEEDAELWLRPLKEAGIDLLSISDDSFHYGEEENRPPQLALAAARKLEIPTSILTIRKPFVETLPGEGQDKGKPVIGGGAMFKGRAVEKLIAGLPRRPWRELVTCPHENLQTPSRVHVDPYGHVHICQGLSMGNLWERPLSLLASEYDPDAHPICGPLLRGGPALLAEQYHVDHEEEYIDECHFCYLVRHNLVDTFPKVLAPRQVYNLEQE